MTDTDKAALRAAIEQLPRYDWTDSGMEDDVAQAGYVRLADVLRAIEALPSGETAAAHPGYCDILGGCPLPAALRYPAMGGGYMCLCERHGLRHAMYCERWDGSAWLPAPTREERRDG